MTALALLVIALMFGLMAFHVPIGIAMGLAGMVGVASIIGTDAALSLPQSVLTDVLTNSDLATIPLFLLMGNIAAASGLSQDLYRFANALMGRFRGGLAMATIVGCGGFGAICGQLGRHGDHLHADRLAPRCCRGAINRPSPWAASPPAARWASSSRPRSPW